jgi:uncharacterized membrane protein YccC
MLALTPRAKEAIKTALAMAIAYYVALSMDWPNPHWAGFAVAAISLSTVGQSLNKGLMRMAGTLLAAAFSLLLIALFPQERWWFFVVLSAFIGYCTYRMVASERQYYWNVAGFVAAIVCISSIPPTDNAFNIAVLRILETGVGILSYTLVSVLLWPSNTQGELAAAVRDLAATQHALYGRYVQLLRGAGDPSETLDLRMQEVAQFNRFKAALAAARTDSYEVWEVRRQWQRALPLAEEVMVTLEKWRESFTEVQTLELGALLPGIDDAADEIDARMTEIVRMHEDQSPARRRPRALTLPWDREAVRSLSQFQKAALAVMRNRVLELERATRALFETVADIHGQVQGPAPQPPTAPAPWLPVIDRDHLAAALRVMLGLWVAYLLWIYTEIPGDTAFVIMLAPFGMAVATRPMVPLMAIFVPAISGIAFGSLLYVFVMPHLAGFAALGTLLFVVSFTVCYIFHTPKQALGRTFGLMMFVLVAGISNEQSYSFLSVANTALMFPLVFAILALTANVPFPARAEKVYLRLLGRFFRSASYLLTTMPWGITETPTRLARWRMAYHRREIAGLPQKLATWGKAVDAKTLAGTTPEQIQTLTTTLQALSYRLQELLDAREAPQAEPVVRALLTDVRAWRLRLLEVFDAWSRETTAEPAQRLREGLSSRLAQLEQRVAETMNRAAEGELDDADKERLYRLLGAYRGLSEAGLNHAIAAEGIPWGAWRESRF